MTQAPAVSNVILLLSAQADFKLCSMEKIRIAKLSELKAGEAIQFQFARGRKMADGFVARIGGEIVAYENVCRHIPLKLDEEGGEIFSSDGKHFICQNHGALYEPSNGLCVRGPCEGEKLMPLKIEIRDGAIWLVENSARTK
jgi:nitrite reductase/ring-hydroxylating ferredoxin subunit